MPGSDAPTIYISEFGKVRKAKLIKETPLGYRVIVEFHPGHPFERLYYRQCPHSNHRSFTTEVEAIEDAFKYIHIQEEKANAALKYMLKLRCLLPEL